MPPADQPSNDNGTRPPLPELSPLGKRIELGVSLVVIAAGIALMIAVLDADHWRAFAVTIAVMTVCAFAAAGLRWLLTGRA